MSVRREVAAGAGALVDAGTTTSAGEGCGRTFTYSQVVGRGMALQLDQHDCGLLLRRLRLEQGHGGVGALQRAVLLNCGLEHDLCERRRDRLEHQAINETGGKQADQALLIARAADGDHDERGLGFAQPLRHEPQRLLIRNLIGEEDAAAAAGCELDCFIGRAGRGDRMVCGGGVVNRVGERRIFGQNRNRNARGRVDGYLSRRPPAESRDSEFAGASDVMQVAYAHCATLQSLRRRRNWTEGRAAVRLSRDLLDDHGGSVALREVHAERARGEADADDEAGERQANGALDGVAILLDGEHGDLLVA